MAFYVVWMVWIFRQLMGGGMLFDNEKPDKLTLFTRMDTYIYLPPLFLCSASRGQQLLTLVLKGSPLM